MVEELVSISFERVRRRALRFASALSPSTYTKAGGSEITFRHRPSPREYTYSSSRFSSIKIVSRFIEILVINSSSSLKNLCAIVSTVAGTATKTQTVLIDAAAAAGVKRLVPSEYGSVTTNPKLEQNPFYEDGFMIRRYLQERAKTGELTWTVLAPGAFTEFLLPSSGSGLLDFADRKATLLDEGDNRISSTSLVTAGKAIVAVLQNLKATENRVVKVSEVILTQNQVLQIAQKLKPEDQWEINRRFQLSHHSQRSSNERHSLAKHMAAHMMRRITSFLESRSWKTETWRSS